MTFILGLLIGMICGIIAIIIRLGIKGDLVIHYVDEEDKPYMVLELDSDITAEKVVVLRVRIRDHRTQK